MKSLLILFTLISFCFSQTAILDINAKYYDGINAVNKGSLGNVRDGHEEGTVSIGNNPKHFSFDGDTANHIRSNTTEATPSLLIGTGTLEAYISIDDLSAIGFFFAIADTGLTSVYFQAGCEVDSQLLMNLRNSTQRYVIRNPTSSLVTNTWYHIIWQIDNTEVNPMRMYVDNVLQTLIKSTVTDTTVITDISAGTNARMKWSIGGTVDTSPIAFAGDVSFVRLYNSYLTSDQIAILYRDRLGLKRRDYLQYLQYLRY